MTDYLKHHERQRHMKERLKYNGVTGKYMKHINKHNKVYVYSDSENIADNMIIMRLGRQR